MDMYLLLRNNKESGPYSLDDLKSMGLKAYDLVWLEGKSAAWRYPCEIAELSAFAPPVDEQPFDRFYKKPAVTAMAAAEPVNGSASPSAHTLTARPTPVATPAPTPDPHPAEAAPAPSTPIYAGESSAVPGKHIIYVTMPAGRSPVATRENPREPLPLRETPREPAPEPPVAPVHAIQRTEDYSAQLPSLKEQLEAVSPRRKRKENTARIVRPLVVGATVLALLAAGVFIGLSLNKNPSTLPQTGVSKNTDAPIAHPVSQQLPASAITPALTATTTEKPADSIGTRASHVASSGPSVPKFPRTTMAKERPGMSKKGVIPPPVIKDSVAGANSAQVIHRADIPETKPETPPVDKEAVKTSVSSQVSVGANGYKVGTFGGINDLQLTVTNRSVYPLDLVVVEVQYIQANKKVYKTEDLYFRNIGAGSALMQEAPKSSRGIKVQYKITTISSKDLH